MTHLSYCTKCGKKTLQWDGEKKQSCTQCDYVLYHNCAAAVAVIIKHDEKILLTRRNQEPHKGKLDLSGGFTDPKESAEDTCRRELKEELDITIDSNKLKYKTSLPNTYIYKQIMYNTLDLFFEYEVNAQLDIRLEQSEISDYIWLKVDDINIDDIAFDSQKKYFTDLKKV